MSNLTYLRLAAREIFDEALKAVDPYDAVRRAIRIQNTQIIIRDARLDLTEHNKIYSIAIGKAALPMAIALDELLGEKLTAGIISTSTLRYRAAGGSESGNAAQVNNLRQRIFQGGHPEPNEESLAAAKACFDLLEHADKERVLLFFLISGGGSAMLERPISEDITLDDLRAANKALVNCGASISEINAVRRAFSAVKGGRLAARAPNCDQITLIVSDVPDGQEHVVASGPTLAPLDEDLSAGEIVTRYGLRSVLPQSVLRTIDTQERLPKIKTDGSGRPRKHFVLLSNNSALEAAAQGARERGFSIEVTTDISDQPIAAGCAQLLTRLNEITSAGKASNQLSCLISGGEFACPVRGDGIGGRNLETALRLAIAWDKQSSDSGKVSDFVALCAGTDGIDGNSSAAGAIVDNTTIFRARAIGLNAEDFLDRSDSYSFFVALGDAITTGPTGTNVRDLRILLQNRSR